MDNDEIIVSYMSHPINQIEPFLQHELQRHFRNYLRGVIQGASFAPIHLSVNVSKPESTKELHEAMEQFMSRQKSESKKGWMIEWKDLGNVKRFGKQLWPKSIIVATEEDYLYLLGKEEEVTQFKEQLAGLLQWNANIIEWLANRPEYVLQYEEKWKPICSCVETILTTDISQYYIRSLPVDAHSKFIERNDGLILSVLKHLDRERFAPELKSLKPLFRKLPFFNIVRWLDQELANRYSSGMMDGSITTEDLRIKEWQVGEIWFVENKTNLYNLPQRPNTLAIFAQGYALARFENIHWWKGVKLRYWGDLDVAGFHILHYFREMYGHVESVLMDDKTVQAHQAVMRQINKQERSPGLRLLEHEERAYQLIQPDKRIEQEQLRPEFVEEYLKDLNC